MRTREEYAAIQKLREDLAEFVEFAADNLTMDNYRHAWTKRMREIESSAVPLQVKCDEFDLVSRLLARSDRPWGQLESPREWRDRLWRALGRPINRAFAVKLDVPGGFFEARVTGTNSAENATSRVMELIMTKGGELSGAVRSVISSEEVAVTNDDIRSLRRHMLWEGLEEYRHG